MLPSQALKTGNQNDGSGSLSTVNTLRPFAGFKNLVLVACHAGASASPCRFAAVLLPECDTVAA